MLRSYAALRVDIACLVLLFTSAPAVAQETARSFGERQLEQLLDDRPSMRDVLPHDDVIVRWVIRKFDTGSFGDRIYWIHTEPHSGREAECQPAAKSSPALIRITSSDEVSGRDKWYMLIFELENIQNANQFAALSNRAMVGAITREEYALQCVKLELAAGRRAKKLLRRHPLLDATDENAPMYMNDLTSEYDDDAYLAWLNTRSKEEYDPREYFAKGYDALQKYGQLYRSR